METPGPWQSPWLCRALMTPHQPQGHRRSRSCETCMGGAALSAGVGTQPSGTAHAGQTASSAHPAKLMFASAAPQGKKLGV